MIEDEVTVEGLAGLRVPQVGRVEQTSDPWMPCRLLDPTGVPVEPVSEFFRDSQAAGRSPATVRSYGMDLLRWFRFLWAIGIGWDRATRVEARDFCRLLLVAGKPSRPHWRNPGKGVDGPLPSVVAYAPSVRAHSETVLRGFYDFHLEVGTGPIVNPFPLDRSGRGGRPHAHHDPMELFRNERTGLYRPRVVATCRSSAAGSAGRWRWPLTRRNWAEASTVSAAHQRNAICPSHQRLTLWAWSRQMLIIDSMALVERSARMAPAWPTATLVHLPVHASWLNQVEIYFSIL